MPGLDARGLSTRIATSELSLGRVSPRAIQENAMTFQLRLDIAASPATVFDFVADFTTMPRWYSAVQRVDRIDGTSGLGTRYEVHRHLP
jgi:hypothetical protein